MFVVDVKIAQPATTAADVSRMPNNASRETQPIPTTTTVTRTAEQLRRWTAAADFAGLTVDQWLAKQADAAADRFERGPIG